MHGCDRTNGEGEINGIDGRERDGEEGRREGEGKGVQGRPDERDREE